MIRVFMPESLTELLGVEGDSLMVESALTLSGLLCALETKVPGISSRLLQADGEIRPHINIFIGDRSARTDGGTAAAVHDGDEVWIIPAVSGGDSDR